LDNSTTKNLEAAAQATLMGTTAALPDFKACTQAATDTAGTATSDYTTAGSATKPPTRRREWNPERPTWTETGGPAAPRGPPEREPPELWRFTKVAHVTGLSRAELYRAINRGEFPRPVKITPSSRGTAWISTEVLAFIHGLIRARDDRAA
jgi:predicted DNA-binding transcriptional regulator AlpA